MRKDELLGRWLIDSWVQSYDDGREVFPLGERLEGFLQYDDARMVCMIASAGRKPFKTGGQWNAGVEEKAAAYDEVLFYSGSYELAGDTIIHVVDMSLYPNWVGSQQKRSVRFDDGRLFLTARLEDGTPEARTASLAWRRG